MRVLVTTHIRFTLTPDGRLWVSHPMGYEFWRGYLDVFDEVHLMGRMVTAPVAPRGFVEATGPGTHPVPAPDFVGVAQYLARWPWLRSAVREALAGAEALMMRVPQPLSQVVWSQVERGRPYAVELTADPYEVFARGALDHPLRPLMRWWYCRRTRAQCARATCVNYVTAGTSQRRYPPGPTAFAIHCSDIVLDHATWFAPRPPSTRGHAPFRLICVGTLAEVYKGQDVLIDAVAQCVREGLPLEAELVGDGRQRAGLEARAAAAGIGNRVSFAGHLSSASAVRDRLDQAHLFVLPSRTEGLPRALLEAMARGLPAICAAVGGIPELLAPDDLVPPGQAPALARKIREVMENPARRAAMSARNFARVQEYREENLREHRNRLFRRLRDETAAWLRSRG